jgi:hypothetical protein
MPSSCWLVEMRHFRTYESFAFLVLLWVFAQGCEVSKSASESAVSGPDCVGPACQKGAQLKNTFALALAVAGAGMGGAVTSTASVLTLCGVQKPSCDPDDTGSCRNAVPPIGQGGASSVELAAGAGSIDRNASSNADTADGNPKGDSLVGGGTGAGGSDGTGGASSAAGAPAMACRIQRDLPVVLASCEPAGTGTLGAPCVSRANCAAGLACVEENGTAQCRPYCCRGVSSCPAGTYCDSRPTKELVATTERLSVSVCVHGVECRFDDPFPCLADRDCSCPTGKTCGLVRADGTTACITPGNGTEGQPCPCAAGHVCAETLGTCFKVCRLVSNAQACSAGFCQASANLASIWGICLSSDALL